MPWALRKCPPSVVLQGFTLTLLSEWEDRVPRSAWAPPTALKSGFCCHKGVQSNSGSLHSHASHLRNPLLLLRHETPGHVSSPHVCVTQKCGRVAPFGGSAKQSILRNIRTCRYIVLSYSSWVDSSDFQQLHVASLNKQLFANLGQLNNISYYICFLLHAFLLPLAAL